MFWVLFAAAVIIIMALGGGGGGGGGGEGISPVAHFGFPAEFHMVNEEEGEMAGIGECPQVLLGNEISFDAKSCAKGFYMIRGAALQSATLNSRRYW